MFRFRTALVAVFLALSFIAPVLACDDRARPRHHYG